MSSNNRQFKLAAKQGWRGRKEVKYEGRTEDKIKEDTCRQVKEVPNEPCPICDSNEDVNMECE